MEQQEFISRIACLRPTLMVAARRLTGNNAEADDLVQEVMLRLWTMRQQLDLHPNPTALATTMMHHLHTDHQRHRKLEQGRKASEPTTNDVALRAEQHDDVRLVGQIISQLPPLQAQVLRMKDVEGYETSEIAAITATTADNVRQLLSRARRTIRTEFLKLTTR